MSLFTLWGWFMTKFKLRGYLYLFITNILEDSVHTFYICLVLKHYCFTMTHPVPIMDRVLYDRDLHHKIVKNCEKLKWRHKNFLLHRSVSCCSNFVNTFQNHSASLFWTEWNLFNVYYVKVLENWLHHKMQIFNSYANTSRCYSDPHQRSLAWYPHKKISGILPLYSGIIVVLSNK